MTDPHGVLVVDKPRGPTSHDVVAQVRRRLGTRAVGHAGTLDPMATGVLVVCVGEATKLVPWLTADDKSYEATVKLGVATRSLDADGEITERAPPPRDWRARLDEALDAERARSRQVPPAVSAIKTDGVRAHERVRRGEDVALEARDVAVRSLEIVAVREEAAEIDLRLTVAKGYYVRALARDLAAALGTVAHLTALRRTRSGAFTLDDAAAGALLAVADAAARALPVVSLDERGAADARAGRRVTGAEVPSRAGPVALLAPDGALVAVAEPANDGALRVLRGFR